MTGAATYPERCEKSIRKIQRHIPATADTVYAMMLMTAMLMDLRPEDPEVVEMILKDCGIPEV